MSVLEDLDLIPAESMKPAVKHVKEYEAIPRDPNGPFAKRFKPREVVTYSPARASTVVFGLAKRRAAVVTAHKSFVRLVGIFSIKKTILHSA